MNVKNKDNLNKNEKKAIKYFFIVSFFLAIIINKNYKSFSWAFMNTYLAISLFFYALVKRNIIFWIMVNCVISSMLWYYSLKYYSSSVDPDETFGVMGLKLELFRVMELNLGLLTFGFSLISCIIYWYYNFKKLNFIEIARYTFLSGGISFMFSMMVGGLFWMILVLGMGRH
ncbi:MAG: hypothetical protein M1365_05755 [Actinobacteria bacterium]|nr:hypothetical protein [Actinomycetota bacterium]